MTPRLATALFVLVGPGLELGLAPAILTGGFVRGDGLLDAVGWTVAGALLVLTAVVLVATCVVVLAGAPRETVVRRGPYGRVRHPMYAGTVLGLTGEALLVARPVLLVAAAAYAITLVLWTRLREEPRLGRTISGYDTYRTTVPGWFPRAARRS